MNLANKLSSHVLGMKFMRRTKTQFDKERVEQKHREHFSSPVQVNASEDIKPVIEEASITGQVEEIPSYSQCENWIFGRQSFGGFNPEVEYNVKKGVWKNHFVGEPAGNNEEEEPLKREPDNEVDVPDEEMAATYGSIIGTLAKHFKKKRDRNDPTQGKFKGDHKQNKQQKFKGGSSPHQMKGKNQDSHRNSQQNEQKGGKRSQDHNSRQDKHQQNRPNKDFHNKRQQKKGGGGPPHKKQKFMKPDN